MSMTFEPVTVERSFPDVSTHVYQREIHAQSNDSLSKIVALIPPGSTVLDVGTGSGSLGGYLQAAGGYTVDGLTYNAEEAALAQPHYRSVQTLDLEQESLVSAMGERRYDVVVCADVLEHLRNAGSVLQSMAALLNPGGRVLVSLPNVTHMGVLLALMAGRFVRTQEGLLDATHVHFMDRVGLHNLVEAAGFCVVAQDAVIRNLVDTEFAALNHQVLPQDVRRFVEALPDSSVYQFVWVLQPARDLANRAAQQEALTIAPTVPEIGQVPYFRAQLFQDCGDGFAEKDCTDAFGVQTNELQILKFKVLRGAETRAIRLDLADRPGQIEFLHLVALDATGAVVWKWAGDWAAHLVYHQADWTGARGWLGGRVVRLTGDDPWVQIPLDAGAWVGVSHVELCISGPQPVGATDYPGVDGAQIHSALKKLSEQAAIRLRELELQLDSARSVADFRQSDIDTLRRELQAKTVLAERMTELAERMTELAESTARELTASNGQLATVLQSRSWQLTKGFRWLSQKLRRTTET